MSAIQDAIIQACQRITEKGLTPSVALIKSHSAERLPMQAIIKVLQQWKQKPHSLLAHSMAKPEIPPQQPHTSIEERVIELEKQVAVLTLRLEEITKING